MNKTNSKQLLEKLNDQYVKVHKQYEHLYWLFYMGDQTVEKKFNQATKELDDFRSNQVLAGQVQEALMVVSLDSRLRGNDRNKEIKKSLEVWKDFFKLYQAPQELNDLKKEIIALESKILVQQNTRKEGYLDPLTKKFVKASVNKMGALTRTHDNEKIRKACFVAREQLAIDCLDDFIKLVGLRNEYARKIGFEDFYDYKLQTVEKMTKKEVFEIFENIYQKTKYAFEDIRKLEITIPGLRKPWNFSYRMAGDFTKEEEKYFPFDQALMIWGKTFAGLGLHYNQGTLQLDLLDRAGKHNNGFCHYQDLVQYNKGKWLAGSADFTCNVVLGQLGSGKQGLHTLLHEGGHAADRLNSRQKEVVLNTEYAPASVAWAETHSQFCDALLGSIEWLMRYTKDQAGLPYSLELFERKVKKLKPLAPLGMMSIIMVSQFEKEIYEAKNLTRAKVLEIAKRLYKKYFDFTEDSWLALSVPHIYAWDSSAYYHGYGLSELAVFQWREYFYNKYGYIVDNPRVGKEMIELWKLGSSKTFQEFVKMATKKKLSADSYLKVVNRSVEETLALAKKRIKRLQTVPSFNKKINLKAKISLVHGKKTITTNAQGFEKMAEEYAKWLKK
ncbi:hypothetical protein HY061_00565 [Candidatus Azambacteria bacterium]|nr:hypothetical protein [Candidatus Azambacteria bacterium]